MRKLKYMVFPIIAVLLFAACQPTPENTVVVYGGDLEEKLQGTPAPEGAYDAPESWRETLDLKGGDAKIEFDATVSVPGVTAFPVYKVKQAELDDAQIESLVGYFTEGRDVYETSEPTKAELEEQVILARKNNDEEMAAEYEARISDAPETVEAEAVTDWSADQSPSGWFLTEDGEYAGIGVGPEHFLYTNGFIAGGGYLQTDEDIEANGEKEIGEIAIPEEVAVAAARNVLDELGFDNMVFSSLEKAVRYSSFSNSSFLQLSEELASKGYLVQFACNIDGIAAITSGGPPFYYFSDFEYRAPLYPEEIRIYVDEAGKVQSFVWCNPLEIQEKLSENVSLMPFDEMQQRICDMLTYISSYQNNSITVTGIEMKMALVSVKDSSDEAMYVPAWFIYYTKYTKAYENELEESGESELVLNAVDGGRVLRVPIDSGIQQAMD